MKGRDKSFRLLKSSSSVAPDEDSSATGADTRATDRPTSLNEGEGTNGFASSGLDATDNASSTALLKETASPPPSPPDRPEPPTAIGAILDRLSPRGQSPRSSARRSPSRMSPRARMASSRSLSHMISRPPSLRTQDLGAFVSAADGACAATSSTTSTNEPTSVVATSPTCAASKTVPLETMKDPCATVAGLDESTLGPLPSHPVSPPTPYYHHRTSTCGGTPTGGFRSPAARRYSRYGQQSVEDMLRRGASQQEFFNYFAEHGDMDSALKCLGRGARLNVVEADGRTPLESAAIGGNRDLVRYIFVRTYVRRTVKVSRKELLSLMRMAIKRGYKVLIEVVLDCYNLPVDLKVDISQGHTLLINAAKEGQNAIVEMLCRRGADMEVSDVNNRTALHWAAVRGHLDTAGALIRAKAPLHIKNAINQRPIAILAKVMNHSAFNQVIMDAYGTMVALGFEYLVCSSFPHKMEILMNDINLFTMPALTREPSKQALWGAEGMEEDEEVDVAENSAQDLGPLEYVHKAKNGELSKVNDNLWVLKEPGGSPPSSHVSKEEEALHGGTPLYPIRFPVSFGFSDVFACAKADKQTFQKALRVENGGWADDWFMSIFITRDEGARLFRIYWRACDVLGLAGLASLYLASIAIGTVIVLGWVLYACFLGFSIMSRNALPGLLDMRSLRWSLVALVKSCKGGLRAMLTGGAGRRGSDNNNQIGDPSFLGRSWRRGSNQSQSQGIGAGRGGMEPAHSGSEADETEEGGSDDEEELEDDLVRGDADVISIGCSPIIWGSLVHGIVRGLWDSMTARSKERHTYVGVYKADIINACKAYPDGLLAVLVEYDVESPVFGTDAVKAVVDFKWRTYGRAILKVELFLHCVTLVLMRQISGIMHNPYSAIYSDTNIPPSTHSMAPPHGSMYPQPPSAFVTNVLNVALLIMTFRVFCYEVVNFVNAGSVQQWSSTVWSWVDIGTVMCYGGMIMATSIAWTSRAAAALTLLLWTKVFYFLKGFGPTSSLVQMVVATGAGVKWFLLLLGIIMMGFGSALYVLFRENAMEQATAGAYYDWADGPSTYINLLSILMGNINTADFVVYKESIPGLVTVTIYAVLVVIVMLNLLISIVGTVYEETQEHSDTEFVKAKAQILNEMEQTYMIQPHNRDWFPDQLYFLSTHHDHANNHANGGGSTGVPASGGGSKAAPPFIHRLGSLGAHSQSAMHDKHAQQSLETVRLELQGLMHSLKASAMKQASQKDLLREVLQEKDSSSDLRKLGGTTESAAMKMTVQHMAENLEEMGSKQSALESKIDQIAALLHTLTKQQPPQQAAAPAPAVAPPSLLRATSQTALSPATSAAADRPTATSPSGASPMSSSRRASRAATPDPASQQQQPPPKQAFTSAAPSSPSHTAGSPTGSPLAGTGRGWRGEIGRKPDHPSSNPGFSPASARSTARGRTTALEEEEQEARPAGGEKQQQQRGGGGVELELDGTPHQGTMAITTGSSRDSSSSRPSSAREDA